MNRNNKKYLLIAFFCFLLLSSTSLCTAGVGRGGFAGSFLRIGISARAQALGGGSVALVDGYSGYYNPSGLVFLKDRYATATLHSMALDRFMIYAGYAQSFKKRKKESLSAGFSVGWLAAGVSNIDGRDSEGNHTNMLSSYEHCFFFSFALLPIQWFSLGFNGKLMYQSLPGILNDGSSMSAVGLGFDFGVTVRPTSKLTLGLVVRDIRSHYTWNSQDLFDDGTQTVDDFLKMIRMGAVYQHLFQRLTLIFDVEKVELYPYQIRAGIEGEVVSGFCLRLGMYKKDLTYGFGLQLPVWNKKVHLDYAFVADPIAPRANHIFTWSLIF